MYLNFVHTYSNHHRNVEKEIENTTTHNYDMLRFESQDENCLTCGPARVCKVNISTKNQFKRI